ncbi:MAG: hypothetical protein QF682_10925 [Candidatus Thermoplasmatota archaeon]|nr:hypothetical protein [Candidatus Thermoplasmatota archaeon]
MNVLLQSRRKWSYIRDRDAVAPVIATMLLIVIMLMIVAVVISWGVPLIQENQDETTIRTNRRNMNTLEGNLKQCIQRGPGFQLENSYNFQDSEFYMNKDAETWLIYYSCFPSINITYLGLDDYNDFFDIRTEGPVTYPEFDIKKCWARVDFIDPKPLLGDSVREVPYASGFLLSKNDNGTGNYITSSELKGTVRISVLFNETVISEAWLFSLDMIEQKVKTNSETYLMGLGNGALLESSPSTTKVVTEPVFSQNTIFGSLGISMIDYRNEELDYFSEGRYTIGFEVENRETFNIKKVFNLHIQIDGEWVETWYNYLDRDFQKFDGSQSDYTGYRLNDEDSRIDYLYPANTAIGRDDLYPNNIDLQISRYVVRSWFEEG